MVRVRQVWLGLCFFGTRSSKTKEELKDGLIDLSLDGKKHTSELAGLSQTASERSQGQLRRSSRACEALFAQHSNTEGGFKGFAKNGPRD